MGYSMNLWVGGLFNLAFFIFHLFFWKIFKWREDLHKLLPINRAVMQVLNICLMFVFLIFAYVSLFYIDEMRTTSLGLSLILLIAIFWGLRAIMQLIFFSRTRLMSYVFFVIFAAGCLIYLLAWLGLRN